jgi:hypothetical protein
MASDTLVLRTAERFYSLGHHDAVRRVLRRRSFDNPKKWIFLAVDARLGANARQSPRICFHEADTSRVSMATRRACVLRSRFNCNCNCLRIAPPLSRLVGVSSNGRDRPANSGAPRCNGKSNSDVASRARLDWSDQLPALSLALAYFVVRAHLAGRVRVD